MRGKRTFLIGLIGLGVSLVALLISLLLPALNAPRIRWGEAMVGIIPSAVLSVAFLIMLVLGLFAQMNERYERLEKRTRRSDWDEEEEEEDERRPRRRRSEAYDEDDD